MLFSKVVLSKLGLDKYWMVSRELGKCLPYSKVPPRVCRRKVGDKGGSLELGDLEETEMLQLLGNSSSNNTTDKSCKSRTLPFPTTFQLNILLT